MAITGKWHGCHFKNTPPEVSSCRNGCNKNYLVIPFAVLLYLNIFGILLHFLMFNFEKSLSYFLVSNSLNTVFLRTKYFCLFEITHWLHCTNSRVEIRNFKFWEFFEKKFKRYGRQNDRLFFFEKSFEFHWKKNFIGAGAKKYFQSSDFHSRLKLFGKEQ